MLVFVLSVCLICCGGKEESSKSSEKTSEIQSVESVESLEESQSQIESEEQSQSQSDGEESASDVESSSDIESSSDEESTSEEESESEEVDTYYTVTFDSNGGSQVADATVRAGDKVAKPTDPKKSDKDGEYEFVRWLYNGVEWNFDMDTVSGDITLVAEWRKVEGYTPPFLPED
ncbi:MAG: InlB B-repeat-containing protein [Clostridia bacterium]|nr:InlB B-repeat-containing protein [Clostridia bacterium]